MRPGFGEFALIPACFSLLIFGAALAWAILWVVIGWRFMKAHESVAQSLAEIARRMRVGGGPGPLGP